MWLADESYDKTEGSRSSVGKTHKYKKSSIKFTYHNVYNKSNVLSIYLQQKIILVRPRVQHQLHHLNLSSATGCFKE